MAEKNIAARNISIGYSKLKKRSKELEEQNKKLKEEIEELKQREWSDRKLVCPLEAHCKNEFKDRIELRKQRDWLADRCRRLPDIEGFGSNTTKEYWIEQSEKATQGE